MAARTSRGLLTRSWYAGAEEWINGHRSQKTTWNGSAFDIQQSGPTSAIDKIMSRDKQLLCSIQALQLSCSSQRSHKICHHQCWVLLPGCLSIVQPSRTRQCPLTIVGHVRHNSSICHDKTYINFQCTFALRCFLA